MLSNWMPLFRDLRHYWPEWLSRDVIAGLSVRSRCPPRSSMPNWPASRRSVESVTQLDTSGIQALDEIHLELKAERIQLLVARPKLYMRRYGESTGIGLRVGRENVFPSEGRSDGIAAEEVPDGSFRAFFDSQRRSEQPTDPGDNG